MYSKNITKIIKLFLDTLFPIRCINCRTYDIWLCDACCDALPLLTEQSCPHCKKVRTPHGRTCPLCTKKEYALDGVLVASHRDDILLKKAIHYYKYRFIEDLSIPLGKLLQNILLHNPDMPHVDMILPVPLHARRLRWRGFNQALLLAQTLRTDAHITTNNLVRTRYTVPQVKMHRRDARMHNLTGAFSLHDPATIKDQTILLIDDVMTTGTTLTLCAQTLKDAGAKTVYALVLARD